jgi:NADH dehydrogenase FAD-containing subunit
MTDAEMIRNRILQAFERAEALDDPKRRDGLLTFVVGAEPTGVEMAGAIAVLIRQTPGQALSEPQEPLLDPLPITTCQSPLTRQSLPFIPIPKPQ